MNRTLDRLFLALWAVTTPAMCVALHLVFHYVPDEKVMGAAQRIFYFHVPTAMMTYLAVFVLLGASIAYLWTRSTAWDNLARAATETGLLFCSLVLITGPIWAKPAWGVWWTWEAKLTTTLILWLLLLGSLMLRAYAESRELGGRLAAIVGVVAALDLPVIHKAVVWWRGQHPIVFGPDKKEALDPRMQQAFGYCILVFLLLFALLLLLRYRAADVEERTAEAAERLTAR